MYTPSRPYRQPRTSIRLGQNFLKDESLVAMLISKTDLGERDLVYEIGPGRGIITRALARVSQRIVAVEVEPGLATLLRQQFKDYANIEVITADILQLELPDHPYKVFSNIPFNLTADILRKLLYDEHPPVRAYLIMQKQAAEKYSGLQRETQASVLLKPWYDVRLLYAFDRKDFDPVPSVEVVLLDIQRRQNPLVNDLDAEIYRQFVTYGFGRQRANLGKSYKKVFSHLQWKRLADDLDFDVHAQPTGLVFEQWLRVFQFFREGLKNRSVKVPDQMVQPAGIGKRAASTAKQTIGLSDQRWKHRKAKQAR